MPVSRMDLPRMRTPRTNSLVASSVAASTPESSAVAKRAARRGRLNGGDPIGTGGAWDLTTAVDA
jgi:hypothetical protein